MEKSEMVWMIEKKFTSSAPRDCKNYFINKNKILIFFFPYLYL